MKNNEKFVTAEEREQAFDIFCSMQDKCEDCSVNKKRKGGVNCSFAWMDEEYDEAIAKKIEIWKILKQANEDISKQCAYFKNCKKCKYFITGKTCNLVHLLYWLAEHDEIIKKIKEYDNGK